MNDCYLGASAALAVMTVGARLITPGETLAVDPTVDLAVDPRTDLAIAAGLSWSGSNAAQAVSATGRSGMKAVGGSW